MLCLDSRHGNGDDLVAYIKTNWKDRIVEFARRYIKTGESSDEVTLMPKPGLITEEGTPITAANLNKIEQGVADAHALLDAATNAATANTMMKRDANSRVQAASPITNNDLVNLAYVNTRLQNSTSFRMTSGILEFYDGSVWKPVGGVKSVQRGTAVVNSEEVVVAISSVAMNKSLVFISNSARGSSETDLAFNINFIRANLSAANQIKLRRTGTSALAVDVDWQVIEYY